MRSVTLALLATTVLIPTVALAQTTLPQAYAERSKVVATDRRIRLFGLPTVNTDGVTKYFDVTVTLQVLSDGNIGPRFAQLASYCLHHNFAF